MFLGLRGKTALVSAASKGLGYAIARELAAEGARSEEHTSELQSPCNLVCRLLLEKKKISMRNIRRRITILLTLSNLKLLRRITRTESILHRNFTRRQVDIQNRVASNIGISKSTFSVKVLNLFSRSRSKKNKRKNKHIVMLRNKETRFFFYICVFHRTLHFSPPRLFTY